MQKPEMMVFDYGHTLLYEPGFNPTNANRAIFPYIIRNPRGVTFEEYDRITTKLLAALFGDKNRVLEMHEHSFLKLALAYMDLSLSVSIEQAEMIIMDGLSMGGVMPGADRMLDVVQALGIRTGVISNNGFSGAALKKRFDRLLPNNRFEFVMTSSDYLLRKPHPLMFEMALQKAGLTADRVWYCGDSVEADVFGAKNAGIYPVLYEGATPDEGNPSAGKHMGVPIECAHLRIRHWDELTELRMAHEQCSGRCAYAVH